MKRRLLVTSKIFGFALAATAVGCGTTAPAPTPKAPELAVASPVDPVVTPTPMVQVEEAPKRIAATPPPAPKSNVVVAAPDARRTQLGSEPAIQKKFVATPVIDPREEEAMYGQGRRDNDPKLNALRSVLTDHAHRNVIDTARFRPLCDADGYPLVGNVMQKTEVKGTQPSAFCRTVREQEAKSKSGS